VWRFYNARRAGLRTVSPNPGHHALVALEERLPGRFTLVTQNVDGLHVAAGSRNVVELHGNLRRVKCSREECAYRGDRGLDELPDAPKCPACSGLLRPDIVWFGEMLDPENWQSAVEAVATCDVLLVVGTSRQVHPAASLVPAARMVDAVVVEVNPDPRPEGGDDILYLRGPSGVVLPRLVAMSAPE
jgi:NAD-dependent deacetylase